MSSKNTNPQTAPATAADPSAQPAPAADDGISTVVHVGGKEYDATNLSTAAGLEIFRALPLESQVRARVTASIVATFASLQKVAANNGLDPTELAQKWLTSVSKTNAAKAAVAQFSEAEKKAVAEFNEAGANAREVAEMVPGGRLILGISDTARGASTVGGVGFGIAGAAADGAWNGAPRVWNMLKTMKTEAIGQIIGYGSGNGGDQSLAFGSAVEALRLETINKRHGMPLIDLPTFLGGKPSQILGNPVTYAGAGLSWLGEWIVQSMPDIAKYVIGTYQWMTYSGEGKPTWQQMVDKAASDIAEATKTRPANAQRFAELADAAMVSYENEVTRKALTKAKIVAGISTEGVADAVTAPDVTVRDTAGVDSHIVNGQVVDQVTPLDRAKEAARVITGDGPWYQQAAQVGGTAGISVVAANAARGGLEGIARQPIIRPANEAAKAEARFKKINGTELDGTPIHDKAGNPVKGELELLKEQKIAKEAQLAAQKSAKSSRLQVWKTSPDEITALDNKITALSSESLDMQKTATIKGGLAASREATAWGVVKTAATPIKEINQASHLPNFLGGGKVPTSLAFVVNAPRYVMRGLGDGVTHVVTGTWGAGKWLYNSTIGAGADTTKGAVKGVHAVVNDEAVKGASFLEKTGIVGGKVVTYGLSFIAPFYSFGQTLFDIGRGDNTGAVVHGGQTVAVVGTMATAVKVSKIGFLGVGRAMPVVGGLISAGELTNAAVHGDSKGVRSAGIDLSLMGGGAMVGLGVVAVPLLIASAPVTIPVALGGAAVGATVGGIAVAGRTLYNMFLGESTPAPQPAAPRAVPEPARVAAVVVRNVEVNPEIKAAHNEMFASMRMAIKNDSTTTPVDVARGLAGVVRTNNPSPTVG